MNNQKFISDNMLEHGGEVMLSRVSPMDAWQSFISMTDQPDIVARQDDLSAFLQTWNHMLKQSGIDSSDEIYLNVGGDSSGRWIKLHAHQLTAIWQSGYQCNVEIECAILGSDQVSIIGITIEDGEEYWFFGRQLVQ